MTRRMQVWLDWFRTRGIYHGRLSSSLVALTRTNFPSRRRMSGAFAPFVDGTRQAAPLLVYHTTTRPLRFHVTSAVTKSRQTSSSRRQHTSPPVPPPCEMDETYASSLILASSVHYMKTWRRPQNRKYITYYVAVREEPSHWASAGRKGGIHTSAGLQVTLCDRIWHVSFP